MNAGSNAASTIAMISAHQQRELEQHFRAAGAVSASNPIPLPGIGFQPAIDRLVKQGALISPEAGLWYLDVEALGRQRRSTAKVGLGFLVLMALVGTAIVLSVLLS